MIDNRAAGEGFREVAVFTCSHCQKMKPINPADHGYCRTCDHYVCDSPRCNSGCSSVKRLFDKLEEKLSREQFRRDLTCS